MISLIPFKFTKLVQNVDMADPYTIKIHVLNGDPEGVRIIDRMNWTGQGIAFPREEWPNIKNFKEFNSPGIYILLATAPMRMNYQPFISAKAMESKTGLIVTLKTKISGLGASLLFQQITA